MQIANSFEKTLMLGKIEGKGSGQQKMIDSITDSMDMNLSKLWERADRGAWRAAVHRVTKVGYDLVTEQQVHACMLSCVRLFVTPWTVAHQAPLEFSWQEY